MSRPQNVPAYRRHKQSGQAVVTLTDLTGRRRDVLLGKHGSAASRSEYARVIAEWEASGRRLPPSPARPGRIVAVSDFSGLTSSACALARAAARAATDSLDRCMARLRL